MNTTHTRIQIYNHTHITTNAHRNAYAKREERERERKREKARNTSFPRKNADRLKKIDTRARKPSDLEHGCRIPPELADITCASQGRATLRSDLPQIAARKTILFHFRCPHEITRSALEQITLQTRGLARLWDTILTFSTRCSPGTRRNNDPATGRWRHRRSIHYHWHKPIRMGTWPP